MSPTRAPGSAAAIPALNARWVALIIAALDAGVSPETLRKIESGRVATPAFPTIAAIADVLNLSLDDVWVEINQPDGEVESTGSGRNALGRLVS